MAKGQGISPHDVCPLVQLVWSGCGLTCGVVRTKMTVRLLLGWWSGCVACRVKLHSWPPSLGRRHLQALFLLSVTVLPTGDLVNIAAHGSWALNEATTGVRSVLRAVFHS